VVDLIVAASAPEGFSLLHKINESTSIWVKKGTEALIDGIQVLHGSEDIPSGFSLLENSLPEARIVISKPQEAEAGSPRVKDPIVDIKVIDSSETLKEGWVKLKALNPSCGLNSAVFLCYLTKSSKEEGDGFRLDKLIDCLDGVKKWCVARVIAVTEHKIQVHYEGWSSQWDEWIDKKSPRLAKFRTHSTGDTSAKQSQMHTYYSAKLEGQALENLKMSRVQLQELLLKKEWQDTDLDFICSKVLNQVTTLLGSR